MSYMHDDFQDAALAILDLVENMYICGTEPTSFAEASSTYKLGTKATPSIGAAQAGDVSGRKRTVGAISDGVVNGAGEANYYAFTDDSESKLLLVRPLSSPLNLATGSPWTMNAFDIEWPDPA